MANQDYLSELYDFGIELEFSNVNRGGQNFSREFAKLFPNYRKDHDASCETPSRYNINNIPVIPSNNEDANVLRKLCRKEIMIGGEIISPILGSKKPWIEDVYKLCDLLWRYGENSAESLRDSLHVHVNVGKTVTLDKILRLLTLHNQLEAIMYRLGGMGSINRGIENSFLYQRPYLGNSPPVVKNNRYYYPIFDLNDLMNAESKTDFFDKLGDSNYWYARNRKYVTQRYMGLNFYSIPFFGTVEFRHSNKTLIPEYIIAWVNFCIAFTRLCDEILPFDDSFRPLYENRDISDGEFIDILHRFDLDNDYKMILLEIWQKSPTPVYDNLWRLSHLTSRSQETFYEGIEYHPKNLSTKTKVELPNHVDSHVLRDRFVRQRDANPVPELNIQELDQVFDGNAIIQDFEQNIREQQHENAISNLWTNILENEYGFTPQPYAIISAHIHDDLYDTIQRAINRRGTIDITGFGRDGLNIEGIDYNNEFYVNIYIRIHSYFVGFFSKMNPYYYLITRDLHDNEDILDISTLLDTISEDFDAYYGEY